jgi:UDP-sugar transporter A1/2/3
VPTESQQDDASDDEKFKQRLLYLLKTSRKMFVLAGMYGAMNILSFVALRNISAGLFTIIAQTKVFTTAVFSSILLQRRYTPTQWRALVALVLGVLLFSEPVWNAAAAPSGGSGSQAAAAAAAAEDPQRPWLGTVAVLIEVTLSGFASIYFEKVIKIDPLQLSIWERNFQLALGSVPVYLLFILQESIAGTTQSGRGPGTGWSFLAVVVSALGAAGGLLVALSIKYGDSILKTLATTGAIVLSSVLDHFWLGGPLTGPMTLAGCQVILAICNYTFDSTPSAGAPTPQPPSSSAAESSKAAPSSETTDEEMASLLQPTSTSELSVGKRQGSKADPSDDD